MATKKTTKKTGTKASGKATRPTTATKKLPAPKREASAPGTGKGAKAQPGDKKAKKLSLIEAAARVLAEAKDGMNTKQMVQAVAEQGLWTPGDGKTPHATLYAAITREIAHKGPDARFKKADRGLFTANG